MSDDPATGPEQGPPSSEDLAAALAERLARTPVRDVLLQAMATFIDMAGIRLGMGPSGQAALDLTQARQAIEALRALLAVAERELGAAQVRPFREPLAVLQMTYARIVEGPAGDEPSPGIPDEPRPDSPPPPPPGPDPASRLWVPPGTPRGGASG
jgi:hypothetical protein